MTLTPNGKKLIRAIEKGRSKKQTAKLIVHYFGTAAKSVTAGYGPNKEK